MILLESCIYSEYENSFFFSHIWPPNGKDHVIEYENSFFLVIYGHLMVRTM